MCVCADRAGPAKFARRAVRRAQQAAGTGGGSCERLRPGRPTSPPRRHPCCMSHMLQTLGRNGSCPRRCGSSSKAMLHHQQSTKGCVQKAATARHSKAALPLLGAELCSTSDSFVQVRGCSLLGAPFSCQAGNGGIQPCLHLGRRIRAGCRLRGEQRSWGGRGKRWATKWGGGAKRCAASTVQGCGYAAAAAGGREPVHSACPSRQCSRRDVAQKLRQRVKAAAVPRRQPANSSVAPARLQPPSGASFGRTWMLQRGPPVPGVAGPASNPSWSQLAVMVCSPPGWKVRSEMDSQIASLQQGGREAGQCCSALCRVQAGHKAKLTAGTSQLAPVAGSCRQGAPPNWC